MTKVKKTTKKCRPAVRLFRPPRRKRDRTIMLPHHHAFLLRLSAAGTGMTDEALALVMRRRPEDVRGRRSELVAMGLVEDTGGTRRTSSGRQATVWGLTADGRRAAGKISSSKEKARG